MVWYGLLNKLAALALLVGPGEIPDRYLPEPAGLGFLPQPHSRGAALGSPLDLPAASEIKGPVSTKVLPPPDSMEAPEEDDPKNDPEEPLATPRPPGLSISLEGLWKLAQQHQPELQEALALYGEARARQIQAGLYPNPVFSFRNEMIGSGLVYQGDYFFEYRQEVLTAGKLDLDKRQAATLSRAVGLVITEKRFDLLTRIRRNYFDFLGLVQEVRIRNEAIKNLEERLDQARLLFEKAKIISKAEVLTFELLLAELKTEQIRAQTNRGATWGQLAADVGLPDLELPSSIVDRPHPVPNWSLEEVEQGVRRSTSLSRALLEGEAARWAMLRARADAVPNLTVGGGYMVSNTSLSAGGIFSVEMPLPVWDRKQGRAREAEAAFARANAAVRALDLKLIGQTREAWGRFSGARQQLKRINEEILPRLEARAELIRQAYQARAESVNFNDIFQAEQALIKAQTEQSQVRRSLWRAIADLQGLMQIDVGGEMGSCK